MTAKFFPLMLATALMLVAGPETAGKAREMSPTMKLTQRAQPGGTEVQLTAGPRNHWMMPFGPFSPDGRFLVYDTRTEEGAMGANPAIEKVNIETGEVTVVYRGPGQTADGPGCGTASFSSDGRIVFIHGVDGKPYAVTRRRAAMIDPAAPGKIIFLDARDVTPPGAPGALRGGTHAHEWSADGRWIGFTYNDAIMAERGRKLGRDLDLRTVGVAAELRPVKVDRDPAGENGDGAWFTVVVARVTPDPRPGSDEISRAFENAWVGRRGYRKEDGSWQRAQAFIGRTRDGSGREVDEVFIADIPEDIDRPGPTGPLEGSTSDFPQPPAGVTQRRITHTEKWKNPGVVTEPRHWLAPSPDGRFIAFLAKDYSGIVQIFLVRPQGGEPIQLTRNDSSVTSTIAWNPDSTRIAYAADGSVWTARVSADGALIANHRLTDETPAPIFYPSWSPDGKAIAYIRELDDGGEKYRQLFLLRR